MNPLTQVHKRMDQRFRKRTRAGRHFFGEAKKAGEEQAKPGYTIRDKRGTDQPPESRCRVCGSPSHERSYNQPSMECIEFLRAEIKALEKDEETLP